MKKKFAVAGAGFSGLILASELSKLNYEIDVFESRDHIGGNCYTEIDKETNIIVHKYGPHIFHTDEERVWKYVSSLSNFKPYINRVKTTIDKRVYSLPINLHTINQFYNKNFNPAEARDFISKEADSSIKNPKNFEEQALKLVGKRIYESFFKGYTVKQWGINPQHLPSSILKRLPLRFNYDDNYFFHKYQGMPSEGYTPIFEKLIESKKIKVHLKKPFTKDLRSNYDHVFFTGPLDAWFDFDEGRLGYRTLDFQREVHDDDFQGTAVMNYGNVDVPFTRISEHKYFAPWRKSNKTIIFKEYSRDAIKDDIPYYPIRLVQEKALLKKYQSRARNEKNVSFLGRLGTYRYLDMDKTILEALDAIDVIKQNLENDTRIPAFFIED